uniref:NADH-ubiquinone oxidoreductase chain 6 n=1 Tax=Curculionidae sp. MT-2014 TaxID=1560010 RepID=A0A0A0RVE2_9CUCU|nr:NADH dehydrogenase subunit 6 [Curculionidae sp. MT-2014]
MLATFILMSWTFSITFLFLNHPLSLGFILLIQTILISLISGLMNSDFWFSYILFLIMIGGMLVLFIYMTSIASNEKFKFNKNLAFLIILMITMTMMLSFSDSFLLMIKSLILNETPQLSDKINLSMNKYLNTPSMFIMLMLIFYLLITLIAIVKITQSKMGPLRPQS